ncbi:MAG: hypothetical protein NTX57_19110 [Armatimonadetes bacterium]|nr:hypothetical protein [Armatimonadota bacterium]
MLRNRVVSSLIALSALSLFSLSAMAQGTTKPADKKPSGDKMAGDKKPAGGPKRGPDGKFIKAGGGEKSATAGTPKMGGSSKMSGGSKMTGGAAAAGKPTWNANAKRWQGPDGKFMKEADALKAGGKK